MKKNITINVFIIIIFSVFIAACGKGDIDVTQAKYESKIVVDGYLYPGKKVENIRLTRNFPLNKDIDVSNVILYDADASITEVENGKVYKLSYNPESFAFEYTGNDLSIQPDKSYRLDVTAVIDGQTLHTNSTTTVPHAGFQLLNKNLGEMLYREKNNTGDVRQFNIQFSPSRGLDFYAYSVTALDADMKTFIYDNAFFTDIDSADLADDFDIYKQGYSWLQNIKDNVPVTNFNIEWTMIWFYGNYRVILYAGDKNFKDFLMTHNDVKEMDGNFHEPKLHFEGDGIGIFGSAIADTAYFRILK